MPRKSRSASDFAGNEAVPAAAMFMGNAVPKPTAMQAHEDLGRGAPNPGLISAFRKTPLGPQSPPGEARGPSTARQAPGSRVIPRPARPRPGGRPGEAFPLLGARTVTARASRAGAASQPSERRPRVSNPESPLLLVACCASFSVQSENYAPHQARRRARIGVRYPNCLRRACCQSHAFLEMGRLGRLHGLGGRQKSMGHPQLFPSPTL